MESKSKLESSLKGKDRLSKSIPKIDYKSIPKIDYMRIPKTGCYCFFKELFCMQICSRAMLASQSDDQHSHKRSSATINKVLLIK